MSHPFGDLLSQHLRRKHGLNQSRLAEGILQDPSIIGKMCKGQRLNGPQARERVCAIIGWLRAQSVLSSVSEANGLLAAAGMAPLRADLPAEQALLAQLTAPAASPRLPTPPPARRTNLPAPLTSFIGRAQDVVEVGHLIVQKRLVTLTGVGGVGKTRLAVEAAKVLVIESTKSAANGLPHPFPDGIWFVELAALTTPGAITSALDSGLLVQAIMRTLKRPEQAGSTTVDGLQEYLAGKQLLLVLDNCEHLVAVCAALSEGLLHHCWGLHILATSREELRVPGETLYPVLPLALPGATENVPTQVLASAATELLVDRVRATQPRFQVADAEIATLAHICRQLDGIPLALELAAPLTRSLSLAEIATQLDNQMALLTNGYRTAIPRHQTMHSALVWSYRLLPPEEQKVLSRASVFASGWTLAAAQAVCVDTMSPHPTPAMMATLLNQLVAKSLVLAESWSDQRRYRLLEPMRQFAHTQLVASGEQNETQRRHAHYFLSLAEQMAQARDTLQEREWLQKLEPERNNLRAANRWAFAQNEAEFARRFNGSLLAFWIYCSSAAEASYWLEGAIALTETNEQTTRTPLALMAEALALNAAGFAAALVYNSTRSQALFERELTLRRQLDDQRGLANALRGIGFTLMRNDNVNEAQPYVEKALTICRAAEDQWGIAWSLFDLGHLALVRKNFAAAQPLLAEAMSMFQEQGVNYGLYRALLALGHVRCAEGDHGQAQAFYTEALRLQQQMHYVQNSADGLEGLATLAATAGDLLRAVRLFGAAYTHRQSGDSVSLYHKETDYEAAVALTRKQLAPAAWESAWNAGCALPLEQAVAYALTVE